MKAKVLVLILIVAAIGAAVWMERPSGTPSAMADKPVTRPLDEEPARAANETREGGDEEAPAAAQAPAGGLAEPPSWPTPRDLEEGEPVARRDDPVDSGAPELEDVREQVAQNPHRTPPSLLAYAGLMADRMEAALASEDEAHRLFPELESCVRDDAGKRLPQVKIVCLVNAHRLSARHASLKGRFAEMSRGNPELVRLMEMTGLSEME